MIFTPVESKCAVGWVQNDLVTGDDNVASGSEGDSSCCGIAANRGNGENVSRREVLEQILDHIVDAVDVEPRLHGWVHGGLDDIESNTIAEVCSSHQDDCLHRAGAGGLRQDVIKGFNQV